MGQLASHHPITYLSSNTLIVSIFLAIYHQILLTILPTTLQTDDLRTYDTSRSLLCHSGTEMYLDDSSGVVILVANSKAHMIVILLLLIRWSNLQILY